MSPRPSLSFTLTTTHVSPFPCSTIATPTTMAHNTLTTMALLLLVLLLHDRPALAQLDPGDMRALRSIRAWLRERPAPPSPTPPSFFSSWDDPQRDPCTYDGVICGIVGGRERVSALNLGFGSSGTVGLSGRLHPDIGCLSALAQLTLSPGHVSGSIPPRISALASLQNLGLSHNLLAGPLPDALGSLPSLSSLDLSFNRLSGQIPPPVLSSPSLLSLNLAHNRLSGSIPASFHPQSILIHLDLKRNSLAGPLPVHLPASLAFLDASRNHLSGSLHPISGLASLAFVDLSRNRLSGPIPAALFALPMLSTLALSKNNLTGPLDPPALVSIDTLDLSFNELVGDISPLFALVQNLYLNNNQLRGSVPLELVDQVLAGSMQTLFLQSNFLTGIPLGPLDKVPVTVSLCAQDNCVNAPIGSSSCPVKSSSGHRRTRPRSQCALCRVPPIVTAIAPAPDPGVFTPSREP